MSSLGQTSVTIRTATPKDMPAIVGIYNWAVNQTFATIDSEPLSTEEAAAWWDEYGSRRMTLVAEDEGVVGWAQLMPWRQRGYEVVEDLVYVDPVYQKRGVGRELLARAVEAARSTGLGFLATLTFVVLPQALRLTVPPITNRTVAITKNTALGTVIGVGEILNQATTAQSFAGNATPLMMGAIAYVILFIPVVVLGRYLETRFAWRRA